MTARALFTVVVLLAVSSPAGARRHRRGPALLAAPERSASSRDHGAVFDEQSGAALTVPGPVKATATFVEVHSARVENDLMLLPPTLVGITPAARTRDAELFARAPAKKGARFFAPSKAADDLEVRRDRDRLLLFRTAQPQGSSIAIGLAMFAATTLGSAHAPRFMRVVFDGPVHLGPAVFDGGGMGAGIAGRGL